MTDRKAKGEGSGIPTPRNARRREQFRIDEIIGKRAAKAGIFGKKTLRTDFDLVLDDIFRELAGDRDLCRKIEAIKMLKPKAWSAPDGYTLVETALRARNEWQRMPRRNSVDHREHYLALATRAKSLAGDLRPEDQMLIPLSLSASRWMPDRAARGLVLQMAIALGCQTDKIDISRVAGLLSNFLKLWPPSVPDCLEGLASEFESKAMRGTETPRPARSRRTFVLRRMVVHAKNHHEEVSPTVIAAIATVVLGEDVSTAEVTRLVKNISD